MSASPLSPDPTPAAAPDAAAPAVAMPAGARRRLLPARRWLRGLLYAVAGLLGLWLLTWLALPPLLKWQGEKIASEQLGRAVRIGTVEFKPWTLELALNDVSIAGTAGAADQFSVKRIYANAAAQSIVRLAPVLDALQVEAPALRLTHLGDGRYDVDDILARLAARPKPPEPDAPAPFALFNIELNGGSVDFDDRAVGQRHELRELRLKLPFISNLPSERQIKVEPQLAFVANGSAFDSSAEALPFDASRQTAAAFRLSGLNLEPYLGYLPAGLPIQLQAATVDADLRLDFEQAPKPSLRLGGTLAVSGLKSVDRQGAEALTFDRLRLELGELRLFQRQLHLAAVELHGPHIAVRRDKDGQINLLLAPEDQGAPAAVADAASRAATAPAASTAAPAPAASGAAAAAVEQPIWQVSVDKLAVHGGTVDFTDETTVTDGTPAAVVRLNQLELAVATLRTPFDEPLSFSGSAALAGTEGLTPVMAAARPARTAPKRRKSRRSRQAQPPPAKPEAAVSAAAQTVPSIEFHGTAAARGAEVNARIAGLPLALAAPYLAPHLLPRLTGLLDAQVGLQWAPPKARDLPDEFKVAAERLTLRQLVLAERPAEATEASRPTAGRQARASWKRTTQPSGPLASIEQLDLSDVLVDLPSRAVSVGRLGVRAPRVTVERSADQRWMYEAWLPPSAAGEPPAQKHSAARGGPGTDFPWKVRVSEFALAGGTVGWRDAAAPTPVEAELAQLQVEAAQIDLSGKQPIPVELSARVGAGRAELGRLSWRGQVGLTPLSAQGAVDVQRLPVHEFEPYFGDALNIDLLRADASFKGRLAFTQTARGPRARISGDASVEELRTHSRPGTAAASDARQPAGAESSTERGLGGATTTTAAAPARGLASESKAALAPMLASSAGARRAGGLGEELLSWKQLRLGGLDVRIEPAKPPQIEVKDTLLSDFYARLIIHPDGRINLQDVVKSDGADSVAAAPAPAVAGAPLATSMPAAGEFSGEDDESVAAPVAPVPAVLQQVDPMAPIIHVGPVRLADGRVDFSDRFIRPNYSADLSQLNGSLGAFSSVAPAGAPQMAELQLTGRAEGTAALQVSGRLNPLAKPLALDIQGKVSDLELPPLSPYSVKYAGHGIERGKLSMDVAYRVEPDGRLTATNKLVLNQLEFGEPVPGAPASLPVKLATALLADSQGVIDLDLPISGSLNDPQFSIGPIIFKAVVGLIGRAITAPFTLLARALGGAGGEDLAQVAFAPGSAQLSAQAREQLDKVAKALADRPQLKLTVAGTARLDDEREAYQRLRLQALVAAEKRATGGSRPADSTRLTMAAPTAPGASSPAPAADVIADAHASAEAAAPAALVSEAEYPELLKRLYRRSDIPQKPRNALGMQRDIPVPEMERLLMAQIEVGEDAMRQLAVQRGAAVKDYLLGKNLPAERLFLAAARTGEAARAAGAASAPAAGGSAAPDARKPWAPRAELALAAR